MNLLIEPLESLSLDDLQLTLREALNSLTRKRRRFVERYAIDNHIEAALEFAGYVAKRSNATAYRLMKDEKVQRALALLREKYARNSEVTAEYIRTEYKSLYEESRKAGDRMSAISALDKLAKMGGFYAPQRVEARVLQAKVDINSLDYETLCRVHHIIEGKRISGQIEDSRLP